MRAFVSLSQAAEVEETIKRIASHKGAPQADASQPPLLCNTLALVTACCPLMLLAGVEGILICNYDGVALKSTLGKELTAKYAGVASLRREMWQAYASSPIMLLHLRQVSLPSLQ